MVTKPDWYLSYPHKLFLGIDQFLNAAFGGYPDETLSSRMYRKREKAHWFIAMKLTDYAFFWQNEHCKSAYFAEIERWQFPPAATGEKD